MKTCAVVFCSIHRHLCSKFWHY